MIIIISYIIDDTHFKINVSANNPAQENYYLFDHYDEVLSDIGKELGLDFVMIYMALGEF